MTTFITRIRIYPFLFSLIALTIFELWLYLWRLQTCPLTDLQYPEFFSTFMNYLVISQPSSASRYGRSMITMAKALGQGG